MKWKQKLLVGMLSDIKIGNLTFTTPENQIHYFNGNINGLNASWKIHDWKVVDYLLKEGEIGLGETYMMGLWEADNLTNLLTFLNQNEKYLGGGYNRNWLTKIMGFWQHRNNANTKKQAAENIKYHYDLGNDFYKLWLDPTMAYSSAIFNNQAETLQQGQYNKFDRILKELNLNSNSHLLEIGSGWGGFAFYMAQKTGCKVTSITLSPSQKEWATEQAKKLGLSDRVEFLLKDYRDVNEQYDGVASIEMYEAVGEKYWSVYFEAISKALKPHGRAVIQGITINPKIFDYYKSKWDFIQKYIFPGGMLCTPGLFQDLSIHADLITENLFFFASSYAKTLNMWQKEVDQHKDWITEKFSSKFYLMWRYYLSYCEAGFNHKKIDVMQITLKKYLYEKDDFII